MTFPFPIGSPRIILPPSIEFLGSAVLGADGTVFTFSAFNLGAPSPSRQFVVAVAGVKATSFEAPSLVTVDGITAPQDIGINNGTQNFSTFLTPVIDAGSVGDIVVTYPQSHARTGIAVWALRDLTVGRVDYATTNIDNTQRNVGVEAGDLIIFAGGCVGGTGVTITGLTEAYDAYTESTLSRHAGGHAVAAVTGTFQATMDVTGAVPTSFGCSLLAYR